MLKWWRCVGLFSFSGLTACCMEAPVGALWARWVSLGFESYNMLEVFPPVQIGHCRRYSSCGGAWRTEHLSGNIIDHSFS